jgi:hypothetical protein
MEACEKQRPNGQISGALDTSLVTKDDLAGNISYMMFSQSDSPGID